VRKIKQLGPIAMLGILSATWVFAQGQRLQTQRSPAANTEAPAGTEQDQEPGHEHHYHILDGLPILLRLHHDTEVGTNNPVDVYVLVIEMQILNSDGGREPIGLQLFNFYTRYPQDPKHVVNPNNANDCKTWFDLQTKAMKDRDPKSKTWPYVEFVHRSLSRVVQTNEDGAVWWSDDIECWGSSDRFPPF
jgi:hypothetical protein